MIRITLIEIASFLLPFLLFFVWRWQTQSDVKLTATPALKLGLAGALLALLVMILLVVLESVRGGHAGDQYGPPRLEKGRVVPGHFVSEPEATDETGDDDPDADPQ